MDRIILHIDVNNAFLSWTAVDLLNKGYKYDIRNSYSVIGGDESKRHGVVLAKSLPCKKIGIKTAETLYQARKKCRVVKVYSPDYDLYQRMSKELFKLISTYTSDIEIYSIDECFLDYTPVKNLYGDEVRFAHALKDEIENVLGFTVNIGIGNNKLCAKMASDFTKPNKVHTLYKEEVKTKMFPLDVGELFGVGKQSTKKLKKIGINTIEDLAKSEVNDLCKYFKNTSNKMIEAANGIDNSIVKIEKEGRVSISSSKTLRTDVDSIAFLNKQLEHIAASLGRQLRKEKRYCNVVAVILKDEFFKMSTHQMKLHNPTDLDKDIFEASKKLLLEMKKESKVRLIGIRLDKLVKDPNYQLSIFEKNKRIKKDNELQYIVDEINDKYDNKISKASLYDWF